MFHLEQSSNKNSRQLAEETWNYSVLENWRKFSRISLDNIC